MHKQEHHTFLLSFCQIVVSFHLIKMLFVSLSHATNIHTIPTKNKPFSFQGCAKRDYLSKKNQRNHWSFYPSEPFTITHFNVRHPVSNFKYSEKKDPDFSTFECYVSKCFQKTNNQVLMLMFIYFSIRNKKKLWPHQKRGLIFLRKECHGHLVGFACSVVYFIRLTQV